MRSEKPVCALPLRELRSFQTAKEARVGPASSHSIRPSSIFAISLRQHLALIYLARFAMQTTVHAERVCGLVAVPPKHSQTARTRHDMPRRYTYASSWLHSGVSAHDHGLPTLPMRVRPGCQNSKRNLVSVRAKLIYGLWSLHSGNKDGPIASADEFGEKSVLRSIRVVDRPSL